MTQRELDLAKRAASKFLPKERKPIPEINDRPIDKRCTGAALKLELKFRAANEAYEERKKDGATMKSIELEFGLRARSLNSWRSYRMLRDRPVVTRVYTKRK